MSDKCMVTGEPISDAQPCIAVVTKQANRTVQVGRISPAALKIKIRDEVIRELFGGVEVKDAKAADAERVARLEAELKALKERIEADDAVDPGEAEAGAGAEKKSKKK